VLALVAAACVLLVAGTPTATARTATAAASVAVSRGEPVRIVLTAATELPELSTEFENAATLQQVGALPAVQAWDAEYQARFGTAPAAFAALYFDAASILLRRVQQVSRISGKTLVIDRAALAAAARDTIGYRGVTCDVALDPATGNRVRDPGALARCAAD